MSAPRREVFGQKGHLDDHRRRKIPCESTAPPPVLADVVVDLRTRVEDLQARFADVESAVHAMGRALGITHPTTRCNAAISLFSGAGGDTLGMKRAGYTVVAYNEFNAAAISTHETVFPESKRIVVPTTEATDIKKIPDSVFEAYRGQVNLVFAGFPCFVAGTRVLTDAGYMPIEDITPARTLLTHTGQFKPIVNTQRKLYDKTLYNIRIKYHPENIVATDEHPFYVREQIRTWNTAQRKYEYTFGEPKWKPANRIQSGDYFGMVINNKAIVPTFTFNKRVNASRVDVVSVSISKPDEWFMLGYFVGDGWVEDTLKTNGNHAHKIRFAVNDSDKEKVLTRLTKVLPLTAKQCRTGACEKYGCADFTWYTILKSFGKYAHGKIIPEWVHDAPSELLQEFINGYHAADGCIHGARLRFTTVSYNLALGLQRLYMKLGKIASINKSEMPKTCVIMGRTVSQRDMYNVELLQDRVRASSSFIEGNYAWLGSAVVTQTTTTEPVDVYNFEVADDNSYIVDNTIVHNCQGFSHAGKKKHDDARNELVHEFARVARIVQPEWIIGENVKGLLARRGKDPHQPADAPLRPVIDIIKDLFERTGYKITYNVIDVSEIGVPQRRKRLIIVGHRGTTYPHMPWSALATATTPAYTSIRAFLDTHLEGAMELPALYKPAEESPNYWIPTTHTAPTGTPHTNLVRLVSGVRSMNKKEREDNPTATTNHIVEPEGLISFGVRKGGYHGMILNPDAASNTIICNYNLCPRLFVGLYNPTTNKYWIRCMTPREAGQIQGFPADYAWQGTMKEKIAQIGNAVPPPLAERIARSLPQVVFRDTPQSVFADNKSESDNDE